MPLATVERLQVSLGVADSKVAALDLAVAAANRAVATYCKREFERKERTIYLSGTGRPELILPQRPVLEISDLRIDSQGYYGRVAGAFPLSTRLTEGLHWALRYDHPDGLEQSLSGIVERLGGPVSSSTVGWWPTTAQGAGGDLAFAARPRWPIGNGNIRIVYEAGYDPIPDDLISAAEQIAVWIYRTLPNGGIPLQSESFEEYSYVSAVNLLNSGAPILGSARQILQRYRALQVFAG
jgi:hypothetical protein